MLEPPRTLADFASVPRQSMILLAEYVRTACKNVTSSNRSLGMDLEKAYFWHRTKDGGGFPFFIFIKDLSDSAKSAAGLCNAASNAKKRKLERNTVPAGLRPVAKRLVRPSHIACTHFLLPTAPHPSQPQCKTWEIRRDYRGDGDPLQLREDSVSASVPAPSAPDPPPTRPTVPSSP